MLIQSLQAGALVYNDYVKHIEQQQDDRTCLTLISVLCLVE
jgi:hypothetical protein